MGLVSSIGQQTPVKRNRESSDDPDSVARPLQPAYPPNQTPLQSARPLATAPAWQQQQQSVSPIFYNNFPQPFSRPLSIPDEDARSWDLVPDRFSSAVSNSPLPFQPLHPPGHTQDNAKYTGVCYCPLQMGSVQATGILLTRAVRKLEATPPAYLLMPDHPNKLPSPPFRSLPQAPPNTSHGLRLDSGVVSYPGVHKSHSSRDLVSGRHLNNNADRFRDPRPPSVG
ncbi:uncharacterized protein [Macrobrachium rosenbergii]|uniref:uncharacterized protein n=1 Tax=Macrobrachium rosenbergii TaxID=79674 RepID=UPI0034D55DDF